MTKPLDTHLSPRDASQPRSGRRLRTWLVALLGFGAADLLVLNLWAVPKLFSNTTTTDMRAAHSGDARVNAAPAQPSSAAEPEPAAQPVATPEQQATAYQDVPPSSPAVVAQEGAASSRQPALAARQGDALSPPGASAQQPGAAQQPGGAAQQSAAAQQPGAASQPGASAQQPSAAQPGGAAQQLAVATRDSAHDSSPSGQTKDTSALQYGAAASQPAALSDDAQPTSERAAAQAPRAEPPPGGAPPQPSEAAELPADPEVARAFATKAAQRALRLTVQRLAAISGTSRFDALTEGDQPVTQIFFSLGNYTLGPNGKQLLERKLPLLTSDERPILIIGAADPSGTEQVNEKLSDARAQSVAEWLLLHGVDAERIQTHAISHEGAMGSTLDRRVDIWLGGSR